MPAYSRVANGNIHAYVFVMLDTTAEGKVIEATAGAEIYGVSQPGSRRTPYGALDDGFAAIATENINVWGPPEKDVMLRISGVVTRGDRLKATTNGLGITTTSANDEIGAIALDSGNTDDIIPVQLIGPQKY